MNQHVMAFDYNSNLRELSLEEIETVNGGVPIPPVVITQVVVAVAVFWGGRFFCWL